MNRQLALLALSLLAAAAGAQNLNFLKNSASAALTDGDEAYLREAFRRALEEAENNEQVTWTNPETGHSGAVMPLDRHEDFGTTCRTLRISTRAGGREGGGRYRLCLAEDGSWRFAPLRRPDDQD